MTYARGLVAGFAMENMEHLISFAEAFGATRLRYAPLTIRVSWDSALLVHF